jgi:putative ABC transport system substrate-binding protein
MNNRRTLLIALGAAPFAPRTLFAQAKKPPVLIGWLDGGSGGATSTGLSAFKEEFAALGWKEGVHYTLEERWAHGDQDRGPSLAKELAAKNPAIIVTVLSRMTRAATKAAPNTPVVQANGGSLTGVGLANSLARPGRMVTGLTNLTGNSDETLVEKYVEMLLLAAPKMRRVGFLVDGALGTDRYIKNFQRVTTHYKLESRFSIASSVDELERVFAQLRDEKIEGLVIQASAFLAYERQRIVDRALKERWPTIAGPDAFARAGALLSYGVSRAELHRRAAHYVDKILKGAKPGDLPIEQPHRIELVLNLKTAKALGLTIQPELAVRADRVIE